MWCSADFGPTLGTGAAMVWDLKAEGKLFHSGVPQLVRCVVAPYKLTCGWFRTVTCLVFRCREYVCARLRWFATRYRHTSLPPAKLLFVFIIATLCWKIEAMCWYFQFETLINACCRRLPYTVNFAVYSTLGLLKHRSPLHWSCFLVADFSAEFFRCV